MIAKRYLCFAACLKFAAEEAFAIQVDQVAVANGLGVILPDGYNPAELTAFGITNLRFDRDANLFGIIPGIAKINAILASASLECKYESIVFFQDWEFEDRLVELTGSGQFPIVGFEYRSLFGGEAPEHQGHCVLVRNVLRRTRQRPEASIYDPGPDRAGISNVDMESLYYACRKKRAGIWTLSRLSTG